MAKLDGHGAVGTAKSASAATVTTMATAQTAAVPADVLDVAWRKSSYSGAMGNCVEVARLASGDVAVRNSRDPRGPALVYTQAEIAAFLAGAKEGEFDDLAV
ncbi:DUF397 domain-containing protein [Saccharomonospora azurea]|uniref:DUF397 domain-containing protein n=1 Tax=Saccharomonospora azurea NA-128 TaxID=882081 RepID=H8G8W2_9PSEU|nr:DUF397 domain-containing protein [Saccharomonospora azurea]EHK89092.1 hypothetical protein SZMC14600_01959 [Saccharomonospora azurea SZMC 14600]EHY89478.1 protein of unknown function (DUF397) [Saccharomonospora azurea NA-128]